MSGSDAAAQRNRGERQASGEALGFRGPVTLGWLALQLASPALPQSDCWESETVTASIGSPATAFAADVDGDGNVDVLSAQDSGSGVFWYRNSEGDGTVWAEGLISTAAGHPADVVAGDIDGDGDVDAVSGQAPFAGMLVWHENLRGDGTQWADHPVAVDPYGPYYVDIADLDGDGAPDLVSASQGAGELSWHQNLLGDGSSWLTHSIVKVPISSKSIDVGDLDGDGDLDVVLSAFDDDSISWFENVTGIGDLSRMHVVSGSIDGPTGAVVGDIDGDGYPDVLSASGWTDDVHWHRNVNGDGTVWGSDEISSAPGCPWTLFAADLDGDGDLDPGCSTACDDNIWWFENLAGDGSAWMDHTVSTTGSGLAGTVTADVDGDGDEDVIAALSGSVAWYSRSSAPALEDVRLGRPPNPDAFVAGSTGAPVIGQLWNPFVDHGSFLPSATIDYMLVSAQPTNRVVPSLGTLLCLPPFLTPLPNAAAGSPFQLTVPDQCGLVGLTLYTQALSGNGFALQLTNALDVTIGTF